MQKQLKSVERSGDGGRTGSATYYERIHECAVDLGWTTEGRRMEDGMTKDNMARWR